MVFHLTGNNLRPNKFEENSESIDYHIKYGRYAVSHANNELHSRFVNNTMRNKEFYKGRQWENDGEAELFFKDESGEAKNRIKIIKNLIRPLVESYRGNAINMAFTGRAHSISQRAKNRRESQLAKLLFLTKVGQKSPELKELNQKRYPIGDTPESTTAVFNESYSDEYADAINKLMEWVAKYNKFDEKQLRVAENMAFSGMAAMSGYEYNTHQKFRVIPSENFFWDRNAVEYDLSDSDYWGEWYLMLPSEVYEQWPDIDTESRKAIELYASQHGMFNVNTHQQLARFYNYYSTGRIPVYYTYWRDSKEFTFGYVKDEFGYITLARINHLYAGEEKPRYTEKDLIEASQLSPRQKELVGKNKGTKIFSDILRKCIFVPKEIGLTTTPNELVSDIILDWGQCEYQQENHLEPFSVRPPYHVYFWAYMDGEVISPIDDAIDPQRFINRIMSVNENLFNNAGGRNIVYDKDGVDAQEGEQDLKRKIMKSEPIGIRTRGLGITNTIGSYDSTPTGSMAGMLEIINFMQMGITDVTGINPEMQGRTTGQDQLVGVTEMLIQRGALLQQPFYNAIKRVFLSAYQAIATVGKRIYLDNEHKMIIPLGDKGVRVLRITKEMENEDFAAFIEEDANSPLLKQTANNMLTTFLQLQLIDRKMFAMLYNRSTPDDIMNALRKQVAQEEIQAEQAQKAAAMQQWLMEQQSTANYAGAVADQERTNLEGAMERDKERQNELDKILMREVGRVYREQATASLK